jgi:hypothetical protein
LDLTAGDDCGERCFVAHDPNLVVTDLDVGDDGSQVAFRACVSPDSSFSQMELEKASRRSG